MCRLAWSSHSVWGGDFAGSNPATWTKFTGVIMPDGGKGSKPRPFSVDRKTFENNWDSIFKNDYQDELSTEDCVVDALDEYRKQAQELWNDSCTSVRKMRD